jgi:hypothetical protein
MLRNTPPHLSPIPLRHSPLVGPSGSRSVEPVTAHHAPTEAFRRGVEAVPRQAVKLNAVHNAYRIHKKVLMTVTDNGSNFVKAFTEYKHDVDESEHSDADDDESITFADVETLLTDQGLDDETGFYLPPH